MAKSDDEIFCSALEYDSQEQQDRCAETESNGDEEQIARLRKLLRAHRQMKNDDGKETSVLDRPEEFFQAFSTDEQLRPGTRVGAYELVEEIGEGGVGVVFRAEQHEPIRRDVALKLLKPGMDSQRILARFALERQVLAQLDHHGITHILDAGVQDNGRPYFVMELIRDATTITDYASRFGLGLQQRVQLMIEVCEIVQYAHQRGIIHRDLKPSNILLEGTPQIAPSPKVIDFGIAKIIRAKSEDSTAFTSLGERFGTPAYMSPEQAATASDVDIRSDIFSLGVVLFELLTGATPGSVASSSTTSAGWTQKPFRTREAPPPSQFVLTQSTAPFRDAELRGELDWITLKALERDSAQRYQTVADLQKDLERYLGGEPIEAAGPSFTYRIGKIVKRNKLAAIATLLVLLTIMSTSVVTTWFAIRALRAETVANERLDEVLEIQSELEAERDNAEEARHRAEAVLRVFQVQSATGRAMATHFQEVLQAHPNPTKSTLRSLANEFDVERLIGANDRLIVKGDWSWSADMFPHEIMLESIKLSSRQVAAAISVPPRSGSTQTKAETQLLNGIHESTAVPNTSLASFRHRLVEELKKIVGSDDPFIAEVLDNGGLDALEQGDLEEAKKHLQDAAEIWSQTGEHPANAAQSRLFLAETLLKLGERANAKAALQEADQQMRKLPKGNESLVFLRALWTELSAEIQGSQQ